VLRMSSGRKLGIGCLIVAILVIVLIGIMYLNWNGRTNSKVDKAGQYVFKVLKVKYDKNFVINKGHYITNTGGYEFTVHPKNDPEFTFNAWLNGMTESGESDEYFMKRQKNEVKRMLVPYIKDISSDYYISAIGLGTNTEGKEEEHILSVMHANNLSESEMLRKFPYKMYLDTAIHINYNIKPQNENSVLKKVYKLIEFLKNKKFGYIEMTLYFYDFPNKNINKLGKSDINFSLDYRFKAPVWIYIEAKDILKIKNYKDLKKYFIYMKDGHEVTKNEQ
ncbi:MAG: hypothetical protein GY756_08155, partial [bacterium]|nr:hypothetical protein [bacterium]